jgi:hypothetical protein
VAHSQIATFARLAKENSQPNRLIAGQATKLSRTMHDIRYDPVHDELFVTNPFAKAILVFRGGANGEEPPIRIIQGPNTQLGGNPDRLDVDPVHNEIIIPNRNSILVFPRDGQGDVAPIRVISGPDTQLRSAGGAAVDTVNNLLVVGLAYGDAGQRGGGGGLLIFNRTDEGNAKPLRVIRGPQTGLLLINQIQVYSPRGMIVATQSTDDGPSEPEGVFIGVWSVFDSGDVPPRWRLGGPKSTMKKPRGVALDPRYKEIIVADMRQNAVLTYYFPEIF